MQEMLGLRGFLFVRILFRRPGTEGSDKLAE